MKNTFLRSVPLLILVLLLAAPTFTMADTLTLTDGQVLRGKFLGMEGGDFKFEVLGNTMVIAADKVQSLEREGQDTTPAAAAPAPPTPASAPAPGSVSISAGTALLVQIQTDLVTGSSNEGDPFIAVLERDVHVEGQRVFARGTRVFGRVVESVAARRVAGRARLAIRLEKIETGSGEVVINTQAETFEGDRSGTARKVAVGAAIGSVAGRNSWSSTAKRGTQSGAAYGGIVAVMTPGNQIAINRGTLMEFVLSDPVQVK